MQRQLEQQQVVVLTEDIVVVSEYRALEMKCTFLACSTEAQPLVSITNLILRELMGQISLLLAQL